MNTTDTRIEADERGLVLSCPQCGKRNRMTYARLGQTFRCGQCHEELPAPNEPVELKTEVAFDRMTADSRLAVLVDFWASWCGPCKMMAPELEKVAAEGTRRYVIAKLSTEDVPAVAQRLSITAIPTLILFKSGREVVRQAGAIPAAAIRKLLNEAI